MSSSRSATPRSCWPTARPSRGVVRRRSRGRVASGEVVFNTALTGYQEIITDPSYAGQIITFTYPHIGNYGVHRGRRREPHRRSAAAWSSATWPAGAATGAASSDLSTYLARLGVPGIGGIDTRRLTRLIRDTGAIPGAFGPLDLVDEATLKQAAADEPGTARRRPRRRGHHAGALHATGRARCRVVASTSASRPRSSTSSAASPPSRCCPATAPADEVRALEPDGIFLSNGPGDPEVVDYAAGEIRRAARRTPRRSFGICLGHQVLGAGRRRRAR